MAKGNPFMGMARGKVGDIVLTRGGGQQITRARNRNPRNPKTQAQMFQRAVMASVVLMYKAGQSVFDHSFQGKAVGLECMKYFMSVNAKKLRKAIIDDLANDTKFAHVVSPSSISPVPFTFRISEGTMAQGMFAVNTTAAQHNGVKFLGGATDQLKDVLTPGDIYTIICVYNMNDGENNLISAPSMFSYIRLKVKDTIPAGTASDLSFGEVFDVDRRNAENITGETVDTVLDGVAITGLQNYGDFYAIGVIRSREDIDLRSTAEMYIPQSQNANIPVLAKDIPEAWAASGVKLGQSDLILEGGGDFDPTPVITPEVNP